jgi:alpha/beta superfamily hydrolase
MGWQGSADVKYTVQYRGEGEGIYDYGPGEYSDAAGGLRKFRSNNPEVHIDQGPPINVHVNLNRTLP